MVTSDALPIQFWPVTIDTYNETVPEGAFRKCFCLPWQSDQPIVNQFDFGIIDALLINIYDSDGVLIDSLPMTNTVGTVYSNSFYPSVYSLYDDQIQLKIFRGANEIFKSDCIHCKAEWEETLLITYSNARNFASLNYSNVSPDPEFYIRVPAVFNEERFPEEDEVLELSNSQAVQLNSQVKAQRELSIGPMPFYMHRKLKLILKHQFVEIAGQSWVKEEEYEMKAGNKRNLLRQASCWLTEKDYIIRNVL